MGQGRAQRRLSPAEWAGGRHTETSTEGQSAAAHPLAHDAFEGETTNGRRRREDAVAAAAAIGAERDTTRYHRPLVWTADRQARSSGGEYRRERAADAAALPRGCRQALAGPDAG